MTTYSVIVVDAIGLLIGELEMDFETDLEAVASVFLAGVTHHCELWRGDRWIGLFPASADPTASDVPAAVRSSWPRLGPT